jgi:hypothetical protein
MGIATQITTERLSIMLVIINMLNVIEVATGRLESSLLNRRKA